MAKKQGDSKLAVAGALTLALAIAGVLLVKEPLRSSRPAGAGLDMKNGTGEQLVRARLWEDPVAAVQRPFTRTGAVRGKPLSLLDRLRPLRHSIASRVRQGQHLTVLLVTTTGGPYVESTESRIRDRYAVGTALGVACYVPEDEGHLSFLEWDLQGPLQAVPYEWYQIRKTRACGNETSRSHGVLVIWLPEEALARGFFATLTSLSQGLVCRESRRASECVLTSDKRQLVVLDPVLQRGVTFKILGPRSSSALRALLQEAEQLYAEPHEGIGVWPNNDGKIDMYSPWASAMKGLLGYGLTQNAGNGHVCASYETCEQEFYRRLNDADVRLLYDIGSDGQLFEAMIAELERRQVRLGWDAVILIGEWDSFYGRALPIEFRAAACARIATLSEAALKEILVPVAVQPRCATVPRAVDLQVQHPADYESLALNVFRYSYLSGLDGEIPAEPGRPDRGKDAKDEPRDRPEGTSQLDYVRALAARIYEEGEGARAIGILGTDPYDALLIIRALRPSFPHAIFFTLDLDARYLHPSEYKWTRNLVIASRFGLQLEGGLQRDVPPFRSSYQTATYFAVLQAVEHVVCESQGHQPRAGPCTTGYRVALTPPERLYDAGVHPRLFEVGRDGAVDLSMVSREGIRTVHPLRPDLDYTDALGPLKQGVGIDDATVAGVTVVLLSLGLVIAWCNERMWTALAGHPRLVAAALIGIAAAFLLFLGLGGTRALLADHDGGEPFSWTAGVSVWPSELLRLLVVVLCLVLSAKALRDLARSREAISREYNFEGPASRQKFSLPSFWTNLQRVYHPVTSRAAMTVDQAWSWYRSAGRPAQRAARVGLFTTAYLLLVWSLQHWILHDELIRPCRGALSCRVDLVLTTGSVLAAVVLNLGVFDAVMLCRRWIGWVTASTGGWSEQVQQEYLEDYGLGPAQKADFSKLQYLAAMDLISRRTRAVNRLIRYPFIVLLIMIAARSNYFDVWNYPTVILFMWALNVTLALIAAYLLYQAADKAKQAMLEGLSRQMIQALGQGTDHELKMKQIRYIMDEVEHNEEGAFMPLYQQPVVESSLYGVVALLQYFYLR